MKAYNERLDSLFTLNENNELPEYTQSLQFDHLVPMVWSLSSITAAPDQLLNHLSN